MSHVLAIALCSFSVEFLFRFHFFSWPGKIKKLLVLTFRVISSQRISDHWKELVIPRYASEIIKACIGIIATLSVVIFVFYLATLIDADLTQFLFSPSGAVLSLFYSGLYFKLRRFRV